MSCLFPLKELLEYDEYATLDNIDKYKSNLLNDGLCSNLSIQHYFHRFSDGDNKFQIIQCLISILDDAIDQIHILSGGKKKDNFLDEFNKTLEERIAKSFLYDPIFDKGTGEFYSTFFAKQKLRKALTDSSKINEFLIFIRNELKEENASTFAQKITNKIIIQRRENQQLLEDEHKNFTKLKDFKCSLANQNRDTEKYLDKIKNTYTECKDQTQDLLFENMVRVKYVKNWEQARREQNEINCKRAEDEIINLIEKCSKEINTEVRVSYEEEQFLAEYEQDFESKIKLWRDKIATGTEERTIENQLQKERRVELEIKYEELKALYHHRQKEISCYLVSKFKRENAWKVKERRRQAAIKIQTWWRNIMVRCKLGPYNPNNKKKKDKKSKKGKKGKKGKK